MSGIVGHDASIAAFLAAMRGDRPHHGWIFAGVQGLGKASLARQLSARLLAEAADSNMAKGAGALADDHPTMRLIAARSHPDFKWVEREVWQKGSNRDKLVPYDERGKDDLPSRSIRVIQIRWLAAAMATAPSLSGRRIIVIDSADDLETSSANALLKMLEEPPKGTLFILISHSPGRLLPTIRSRCRMLRFSGLSDDIMTSVLRDQLPDAVPDELATLKQIGQGSPGRALKLAGVDVAGMMASLRKIAATGDADNRERAALSQSMIAKSAQGRFEAFLGLVPSFMASEVQKRSGRALGASVGLWGACRDLTSHAVPGSLDPQSVTLALAGYVAGLAGEA